MLFPICTCLQNRIQVPWTVKGQEVKKKKKWCLSLFKELLYVVILMAGINNYHFCNTSAMGSPQRTANELADVLEGRCARPFACQEPQSYFRTWPPLRKAAEERQQTLRVGGFCNLNWRSLPWEWPWLTGAFCFPHHPWVNNDDPLEDPLEEDRQQMGPAGKHIKTQALALK